MKRTVSTSLRLRRRWSTRLRCPRLDAIDLRSERLGKTGAEGLRAKEGVMINKSLLTLGTVINKLSEGVHVQGTHVVSR